MEEKANELLRVINESTRRNLEGKLKIFLGMVAGVGKTYAMLVEAHALKQAGIDVVVGYIETHRRKETEEALTKHPGLSIIPRRKIEYKGKIFEEMDLEAIIARRPQVVLVDELAHTNIPGVKHQKRYQDVLEILQAGINVHSTLNVQHIESCSNTVREITNIPIAETLPDSVIDRASEIVLIDLDPDKVITRLQEGKIYPPEKVKTSLENFFSRSNLTALRELVLRILADKVNMDLRDARVVKGVPQIWKTGHRLLAPIIPTPEGENLIRVTRRLATNLSAPWFVGNIETGKKLSLEEENELRKNITLAKQLGAEILVLQDENLNKGLYRLARNYQVTQLILPKGWAEGGKSLEIILKATAEIDVLFVSQSKKGKKKEFFRRISPMPYHWKGFSWALPGFIGLSLFCFYGLPNIEYLIVGMIYLIFLTFTAFFSGPGTIIITSLITGLSWVYFFIPPRFTFHILNLHELYIILGMVVSSTTMGLLAFQLRRKEYHLMANDEKLSVLYFLTKHISEARGVEKIVRLTLEKIFELYPVNAGVILAKDDGLGRGEKILDPMILGNLQAHEKEFHVANWAFNNKRPAGRYTDTLNSFEGMYLPLSVGSNCYGVLGIISKGPQSLTQNHLNILQDITKHLAIGLEREILNENLKKAQINEAIEMAYKTLLNSVSHELKTPLAVIQGSASALLYGHEDDKILNDPSLTKEMAEQILIATRRMQILIQNMLDMSRIEAGKMPLKIENCDLREVIASVLGEMKLYLGTRKINISYSNLDENSFFIHLDETLFQNALRNILQNACLYTSPLEPIDLTVKILSPRMGSSKEDKPKMEMAIIIRDYGPGLPPADPSIVFQKFFRGNTSVTGGSGLGLTLAKAIIDLHGGDIVAENMEGGGAQFTIKMPLREQEGHLS